MLRVGGYRVISYFIAKYYYHEMNMRVLDYSSFATSC